MNSAHNKFFQKGEFAAIEGTNGWQVQNLRTGKRSLPTTKIRALRILAKVTR